MTLSLFLRLALIAPVLVFLIHRGFHMKDWSFWDWAGYSALFVTVIAPVYNSAFPDAIKAKYSPYIPLATFLVGSIFLGYRWLFAQDVYFSLKMEPPFYEKLSGQDVITAKITSKQGLIRGASVRLLRAEKKNVSGKYESVLSYITPLMLWTELGNSYNPQDFSSFRYFVVAVVNDKKLSIPNSLSADETASKLAAMPYGEYRLTVELTSSSGATGEAAFVLSWTAPGNLSLKMV